MHYSLHALCLLFLFDNYMYHIHVFIWWICEYEHYGFVYIWPIYVTRIQLSNFPEVNKLV